MPLPEPPHDSPMVGWLVGSVVGTIAGSVVGFAISGVPGAALGVILGGLGAAIVGVIIGAIIDELRPGRWEWFWAKPAFSGVQIEASPDPAYEDAPCRITVRYTVVNNDDRARIKVECRIVVKDGNPGMRVFTSRGNATTFGRAEALGTVWSEESDGKKVSAYLELTARRAGREYVDRADTEILVPVHPQP